MWIQSNFGELAAFSTAIFWTITALAFESASLKVGSLSVNIIRLFIGFIFISTFTFITRGLLFPTDANPTQWMWLILSGIIGFVLGDLFLFKSYTLIGSRFAMLIMTLVPPLTALQGWLFLNERLSLLHFLGMSLTILGISLAILQRSTDKKGFTFKLSLKGMLYAFTGAVGQASGLILSKLGMSDNYNPFAATQIRIIAGIFGFMILVSIMRRWKPVFASLRHGEAMTRIGIGSFFGPFLGVSFSLLAVQHTQTGIASTIMAIVPILIIPPSILIFKQRITVWEAIGAVISVAGISLFFIF
ncbi:MAG: DMT family transporter [Bacteroidales bacterium]|jgi:drug/metabolite transporter (DMT)-like permease|nr:DMT family transporter [Bacteroidales bacterium]MDD2688037.1 DMT family transporter [Bacteroidales bacterium]MDD3331075.1 DMT family transporter [Bacteroidales bacterium]MDD3691913.1 DMT family transporter [Bacteroidales bacterium]MDD4044205.1 DMT family transporter [Bacteroidales bacterium]